MLEMYPNQQIANFCGSNTYAKILSTYFDCEYLENADLAIRRDYKLFDIKAEIAACNKLSAQSLIFFMNGKY